MDLQNAQTARSGSRFEDPEVIERVEDEIVAPESAKKKGGNKRSAGGFQMDRPSMLRDDIEIVDIPGAEPVDIPDAEPVNRAADAAEEGKPQALPED